MSATATVNLLDDFRMLEGVGAAARRELLDACEERHLLPGDVVIRQGEPNEAMYLVLKGELGVHLSGVETEPVALIGRGETVGELSLLDGSPASASVVCRTECHLLAVDEDGFWEMTNASHAFAVNLLQKFAARLRANNDAVTRNVEKRRQYERAAMFDSLTGIHNRRWLDDTLQRLSSRLERTGSTLSVSLVDIDHFKRFNDRFGHAAGDHVLVTVAKLLPSNLRPSDLVARYGGEEFVILFPDTPLDQAMVAAERVRVAVERAQNTLPDGTTLPPITISMGVAQLRPGQPIGELLTVADLAMYQAKESGRNRVHRGDPADLGRIENPKRRAP